MKPLYPVLAFSALLFTAAYAPAQTLTSYGSGGFGLNSTYARLYNPATTVTFRGKITGVEVASPLNGAGNSVRIIVKTRAGGSSLVELGPEWFVNHQLVKLHPRDNVTVTGSKIDIDGRGSIMARRVVVGRKALVLRDVHGNPFWNANTPSVSPALVTNSNGSAQEIVVTQPATSSQETTTAPVVAPPIANATVRVQPYDSPSSVYMSPASVEGIIDHFVNNNGNDFMILNIGGAMKTVYIGPDWYIEHQDVVLNPGDMVTATVLAPVGNPNSPAYAESISDNGATIVLQNIVGGSTWAPWSPSSYNPD